MPDPTQTPKRCRLYCSVCGEYREDEYTCRKGGESIPHDDPSQDADPCSTDEERVEERWTLYRFTDTPNGVPSEWHVAAGYPPSTPRAETIEVIPASHLDQLQGERDELERECKAHIARIEELERLGGHGC